MRVEHERRAVEHELVLAADEVHVDDRHRGLRGAARRASPRARGSRPAKYGDALMLTTSSAPFAAIATIGPGSHASSQIDTATFTPAISNSGPVAVEALK